MLAILAFLGFLRYDIVRLLRGFGKVCAEVETFRTARRSPHPEVVSRVCSAVTLAASFYVRPVLCLQKAIVTTRLLRQHGIPAETVIGYRPSPFLSHAWVEVAGRVVNDSPVFQERLVVLARL